MWLIDTNTLCLKWFPDEREVEYAILSHTWDTKEEISFRDMQNFSEARARKDFSKVNRTCHQARIDGIRYAWIDSCCINKDASAELSEAINSMFKWYQHSKVCYAYLSDYRYTRQDVKGNLGRHHFGLCKWFTRGWTLQELIASDHLKFFNSDWNLMGDKSDLVDTLARITGIERTILTSFGSAKQFALRTISVATRMSWASQRRTTRQEDEAYALMGIFNVNMPLLYGEGRGAFRRLQEHIMARSTDHSILLWRASPPSAPELFAPSPAAFRGNERVVQYLWNDRVQTEFTLTNIGIRMLLPVLRFKGIGVCAVLRYQYADDPRGPILLPLVKHTDSDSGVLCVHRQLVMRGENDRFPVFPIHGDVSKLKNITKKNMLLIESYAGYPMLLMQRANVVLKPSCEFARMFTVAEVTPKGGFNHQTQTLSWPTLQSRSSEVVSGSITWLRPGGKGIKLLLTLDHRWPDKCYQIEPMEVQQMMTHPQEQGTPGRSIEVTRRLEPVSKNRSYILDIGILRIEASEAIFSLERIVSISMSLKPMANEDLANLPEGNRDRGPSPRPGDVTQLYSKHLGFLPISLNSVPPSKPRL